MKRFWRRPKKKKFVWRIAYTKDGKEIWVNLGNVTHMMADSDIGTTVLYFGSNDRYVEVIDLPEHLLSEHAEIETRNRMTPSDDHEEEVADE